MISPSHSSYNIYAHYTELSHLHDRTTILTTLLSHCFDWTGRRLDCDYSRCWLSGYLTTIAPRQRNLTRLSRDKGICHAFYSHHCFITHTLSLGSHIYPIYTKPNPQGLHIHLRQFAVVLVVCAYMLPICVSTMLLQIWFVYKYKVFMLLNSYIVV